MILSENVVDAKQTVKGLQLFGSDVKSKLHSVPTFLQLVRVQNHSIGNSSNEKTNFSEFGDEKTQDEIFDIYQKHISQFTKKTSPGVTLSFNIEYMELQQDKIKMDVSKLYGLSLRFTGPHHYSSMNSVEIPFFCKNDLSKSRMNINSSYSLENTGFPTSHRVVLNINPWRPLLGRYEVSARFTTADGLYCKTTLNPVQIQFSDLLQPLPVSKELEVLLVIISLAQ